MDEKNDAVVPHESLVEALAAAQLEFQAIPKNKTGRKGNQEYKYAPLDVCLDSTRPQLNRHGIAVTWTIETTELGLQCTTHIKLRDEELSCSLPMYFEADMKGLGSAMTYAKRYGYLAVIGCTGDEDDDGDAAGSPPAAKPNAEPTPKDPPAEPAKAKFDPTKFESWQYTIEHATKLDTLMKLLERAREIEAVKNNLTLTGQILEAVGVRNDAAIQSGLWTEEQSAEFDQTLDMLRRTLESGQTVQESLN